MSLTSSNFLSSPSSPSSGSPIRPSFERLLHLGRGTQWLDVSGWQTRAGGGAELSVRRSDTVITSGSLFNDCNLSFFALCVHFHLSLPAISCPSSLCADDFHSHTTDQRLCVPVIEILRVSARSK